MLFYIKGTLEPIFLSTKILLNLLVSTLFTSRVLATDQEKVDNFVIVNNNNQDDQIKVQVELTEANLKSNNVTPATPEIITTVSFSPKQNLNNTKINPNEYSTYQLPEEILDTTSSCEENGFEDSLPILPTTKDSLGIKETLKSSILGCK